MKNTNQMYEVSQMFLDITGNLVSAVILSKFLDMIPADKPEFIIHESRFTEYLCIDSWDFYKALRNLKFKGFIDYSSSLGDGNCGIKLNYDVIKKATHKFL